MAADSEELDNMGAVSHVPLYLSQQMDKTLKVKHALMVGGIQVGDTGCKRCHSSHALGEPGKSATSITLKQARTHITMTNLDRG